MHPGRRFPLLSEPKIDRRGKRSAEKDVELRVCVCVRSIFFFSILFFFWTCVIGLRYPYFDTNHVRRKKIVYNNPLSITTPSAPAVRQKDALRRRRRGRRTESRSDAGARHAAADPAQRRLPAGIDGRAHRRHRSVLPQPKGKVITIHHIAPPIDMH